MNIVVDNSINECSRGIYGIFIIRNNQKNCAYVGKSEQVEERVKQHILDIKSGSHYESIVNAYNDSESTILFIILEKVPYYFDYYSKDAQRLASAENYWIDKYQAIDQCLEQVPEGRRPSVEAWEKMRLEVCEAKELSVNP